MDFSFRGQAMREFVFLWPSSARAGLVDKEITGDDIFTKAVALKQGMIM